MNTITINYSKSYEGNSIDNAVAFITEAVNTCFINPVFENIANVTPEDPQLVGEYLVFPFDLGGDIIFALRFHIGTSGLTAGSRACYLSIHNKDTLDTAIVQINGKYTATVESDDLCTYTMACSIDCLTSGSDFKALWPVNNGTFVAGAVMIDTVNKGDQSVNIISIISGSNLTTYNVDDNIAGAIDSTNRNFKIDGKVLIEPILYSENSTVLNVMDNLVKIHNTTLGTNALTVEGSYRKLIEVNGARYRQIAGCYWIEDTE